MRKHLVSTLLGLAAIVGIAVAVRPGEAQQSPPALVDAARGPTLTRFASAEAFERYVRRAGARAPRRHGRQRGATASAG